MLKGASKFRKKLFPHKKNSPSLCFSHKSAQTFFKLVHLTELLCDLESVNTKAFLAKTISGF